MPDLDPDPLAWLNPDPKYCPPLASCTCFYKMEPDITKANVFVCLNGFSRPIYVAPFMKIIFVTKHNFSRVAFGCKPWTKIFACKNFTCLFFCCSAVPLVAGVRAVQGADGELHPVQREDLQDGLSRDLRLPPQPGDARHHRGRERRGRGQAQGKQAGSSSVLPSCSSGFGTNPESRIWIFSIPEPESASKNLSILTKKIDTKLWEIWSGLFIPNPDPGSHPHSNRFLWTSNLIRGPQTKFTFSPRSSYGLQQFW